MNSTVAYLRYTWFILVMVFLVIIAGGVVRMTQSGMGCPDWPTCFGSWIPPLRFEDLPADYEKYLRKQDIDHSFNVYHTWIEYINRLLGALLGLFIFIHTIWSFSKFRKKDIRIFYISLAMLLLTGFQGWLGKRVVDANLDVLKVTTHMIVALVIAALPVLIIARLRVSKTITSKFLKAFTVITLIIVIVQVILGTRVREEMDVISMALRYQERSKWIGELGNSLVVHRSFSWSVVAACILLAWKGFKIASFRRYAVFLCALVVLSFITGLIMYFMNVPALAQPLHLLLAAILAITLFSFRLHMK